MHNTPDGNFLNGIPNPLLPECRDDTRNAVIKHGADMGHCLLMEILTAVSCLTKKGSLSRAITLSACWQKHSSKKSRREDHPRSTSLPNTVDVVTAAGGTPVMSKTGHAFIKERMRKEDAIYGGEMSAHHYFRDFAYCDSGMIPWLLVAELVCLKEKTLGELVRDRMAAFPASGEINSKLAQPVEAINRVEQHF